MPGKNMQGLHGKPLLWHTIEFALNHPLVTDIIVTSDSTGILDSARQCRRSSRRDGFYTVRRPNHLALGQDGSMKATVEHALDQFRTMSGWCRREDSVANSVPPFLVVLLQPTSPFRDGVALSKALMRVKRGDFENAVSVTRPHALVPAGPAPPPRGRYRYDLDGNFWIFWGLDGLPLSRSLSNDKTYFHEEGLPYSIQIDTASDLRVAQDLRELRL